MSPCHKKNVVSKTHQKSKPPYDRFGRREDRLHFLAQELCRLYERYDEYKGCNAKTTFSNLVRELFGLYFGQNRTLEDCGLISKKAREAIRNGRGADTESDHVVPMKVLQKAFEQITKERNTTIALEKMEDYIRRNAFVVRITNAEHAKLAYNNVKSKMSPDWKDGDSPWKRYLDAEIVVVNHRGYEIELEKTTLGKKGCSSSMATKKVRTCSKGVTKTGMSRSHCKKRRP